MLNVNRVVPESPNPSQLVSVEEVSSGNPFASLNNVLEKWFYKPDLQAIRIVLGTIKAHYLNIGDPAWLFVVAPPGAGKSTMSIMGASGLRQVIMLGDFTESTFLSGFHGHQQPGLLEKLGETKENGKVYTTEGNAIFLAKDFTTVLSMRREKRAAILSQLREIHDGQFKRDFGTGVSKVWKGRVTIIAAVTPALDRHYSIFSSLGERFLQLRWNRPDSEEAGQWAIRQQGKEEAVRAEVQQTIKGIFDKSCSTPPSLSDKEMKRIASFAEVIAIGRTYIFRSSYGNREIEYVPESEANTRISKGLAAIARGVAALKRHKEVGEEDLQDAFRVGLDCLPPNRRQLIVAALRGRGIDSVQIPLTMRGRAEEELRELGILAGGLSLNLTERAGRLLSEARLVLM